MRLHLVDHDPDVVSAWRQTFAAYPEVTIEQANLLSVAHNTVVSPANSHGFMDGGIDLTYMTFFGPHIQEIVQDAIAQRPEGHLPVGASLIVRTGHARIPFIIVAPTMILPEPIQSFNCYRAMRAILRIAATDPVVGQDVFCPGLGTGVGQVPPSEAASQMARAYGDWKNSGKETAG